MKTFSDLKNEEKVALTSEEVQYYAKIDCAKDASETYNIKYGTLMSMLYGQNKNRTNLTFC